MDVLITILCASIVIGFLVFIHEGGHYLAARAFGVRVTEFMLGLPGPSIGFTRGGTRFGVTAIPLGGYARVCGMEPGGESPHLVPVIESLYRRGEANMEQVAADCDISDDEAYAALEQLASWGSCAGPGRKDKYNTYRAPRVDVSRRSRAAALAAGLPAPEPAALGEPRHVEDPAALIEAERSCQYRSLPFWKRTVVLLAGIAMNLLFVVVAFILIYTVFGIDLQHPDTGETVHFNATPLQSLQIGLNAIAMTAQAILGLFNPATAAETVSNSTSIVGIAVMSKSFFEQGLMDALFFMAMISMSLGLMNLLPIPPLDGGRFVIEVFQRLSRKTVSEKALNTMSMVGMALFLCLFAVMLNQDIQRFIFGNWG